MPLSGGHTDKFGNRYEGRWTVYCLSRILDEKADSITFEPVGEEGRGIEFFLKFAGGVKEYHQVKRQHSGQGPWSVQNLESERILSNFWTKLKNVSNRCVFVSTSSADTLRELTERARTARSGEEFRSQFITSQRLNAEYAVIQRTWENCTDEEAFQALRRIYIETWAEEALYRELEFRLSRLIEGTAEAAIDVLAQLALDSLNQELYATQIWSRLESAGLQRGVWTSDSHVLARVDASNDRYLRPILDTAILGTPIPREETRAILSLLQKDGGKRVILASGSAGTGKSGVAAEVLEEIRTLGWSVLALRMDRLEPVPTVRQVGQQMDLPESPVIVLGEVSREQKCLLLIDQMDAVSTTSGRNPQFFERVDEMIRQSGVHPNMRVLLLCRHFDLGSDERFRRLIGEHGVAEEVKINLLSEDTVWGVVQESGIDPQRLSEKQRAFLALPLHLKLLTDLLRSEPEEQERALRFETLRDLYDQYWEQKQRAVRQRMGSEPRWGGALDALLSRMVGDHALSTPVSSLDDYSSERAAMLSEGVLLQEGRRLSLFHETFFDYAFARRFTARGDRLLPFLRANEQHLFLRATVRQILAHERDEDESHYLSDLEELLNADDIRFHLKHLTLQLLRTHGDPSVREWEIVRPLLSSPTEPLKRQPWTVLYSGPWFRLIDSLGFLSQSLDSADESQVVQTVNYLASMGREMPERVAELAVTFLDKPEPWPQYAQAILAYGGMDKSRRLFDLYQRLADSGILQEYECPFSQSVHSFVDYDLPEKRPEWAAEVMESWLLRRIAAAERMGEINPFAGDRFGDTGDRLEKVAGGAPLELVERMLPIVLELVRRNAQREDKPPWRDAIWPYRYFGGSYSLHDDLLEALVTALRQLAVTDPDVFKEHAAFISQYGDFETAGFLLARAYAANGQVFANEGAEFLLSNPVWLDLGWADSSHWVSRQLIEAVSSHCTQDIYDRLESFVLDYYPEWERNDPKSFGYTQLALLNGFDPARRGPALKRRLGELQRKFERDDCRPPRRIAAGTVGPPFAAIWEHMKDQQWINAIMKYGSDERIHARIEDFLKGGASQLAHVLRDQAKQDPRRFARLLLRLPTDANPAYFQNILIGLSEGEKVIGDLIPDVCHYCHALPGTPCGRDIGSLVKAYADSPLPDDILDMIGRYAAESPDPEQETWQPSENGRVLYRGDPSLAGLNSVRGHTAWTVAALLFSGQTRLRLFHPYLVKMVEDPSIAVRTQVAYALLPVLNVDRDLAVDLFLRLCDVSEDALFSGHFVREFLIYASYTHYQAIAPIVKRMLQSPHNGASYNGAIVASFASLLNEAAMPLAEQCLTGAENQRKAAAEIAAANISSASNRVVCERRLITLFSDDSKDVQDAASRCFERFDGETLGEFSGLVSGYIESPSFLERSHFFFKALERTTAALPDIVCRACERQIDAYDPSPQVQGRRFGPRSDTVSALILRLYERTRSDEVKRRCLDLIDKLLESSPYDLTKALSEREE